ncbi:MAG: primosome assembly protein PriA [Intrasporangium sp.]|uniref:primosomal protein N' family DNA-binding protein n=1 Tax=Intrasporangium sp. TaxID=1925024 RepID=UPI003F81489E
MSDQAGAAGDESALPLPVAAVVVDTPLAHLDRVFEYAVPEELLEAAAPGARVRVHFAGRELDGFVVERRAEAEHGGRLSPLRRVVSPEPVLTPPLLALCRAVADRYAGSLSDVLRLAVPKRHATAERNLPLEAPAPEAPEDGSSDGDEDRGPWAAYPAGGAWLRRVAAGEGPAAAWSALPARTPGDDWPRAFADAAAAALRGGRGAVLVVPDHRDVDRLDAALTDVLGRGRHVRLTADQGPQARYTAWLKVLRGHVDVAIGTRAAAFAPVRNLGLVAWWDDGDDLLDEPRSPYPHSGTVLQIRAAQSGAAVLAGGYVRSLHVQEGVERGRLLAVEAEPTLLRAVAPRVTVAGEGADEERDGPAARAHLPSRAWRVAKDALHDGPVLVQVPRRGYLPSLSCAECRTPVRCARCHGPVAVGGPGSPPACRWCGAALGDGGRDAGFECRECGSRRLRSSITGARRTAEEIGRAFPGAPVITSGSGEVHATVEDEPAIVIATPGAEPLAPKGYSAVLLLDAWASLDLPVLDASTESLRRWAAAAALARPGRTVVLCGVPDGMTLPAVEALVRWDPGWLAERELADRRGLGLPPSVRMAQLSGSRRAVEEALRQVELPGAAQVLGPMPVPDLGMRGSAGADQGWHALVRVPVESTPELTRALQALKAFRSARKEPEVVTVRVDPTDGF